MEKTAHAFARNNPGSKTIVSVVRYGNVMYSRGSVIPLFVDQVKNGEPLTLTDPGMTRFLMSLAQSVELVEYAFTHAQPGDLFVRKAPAATVEVLARAVASMFGVDPGVRVIGTRHGEKLYETLLSREEMAKAENFGTYFRVPLDSRSLDYGLFVEQGDRGQSSVGDYTSHNTERLDLDSTVELLRSLPEFSVLERVRNS